MPRPNEVFFLSQKYNIFILLLTIITLKKIISILLLLSFIIPLKSFASEEITFNTSTYPTPDVQIVFTGIKLSKIQPKLVKALDNYVNSFTYEKLKQFNIKLNQNYKNLNNQLQKDVYNYALWKSYLRLISLKPTTDTKPIVSLSSNTVTFAQSYTVKSDYLIPSLNNTAVLSKDWSFLDDNWIKFKLLNDKITIYNKNVDKTSLKDWYLFETSDRKNIAYIKQTDAKFEKFLYFDELNKSGSIIDYSYPIKSVDWFFTYFKIKWGYDLPDNNGYFPEDMKRLWVKDYIIVKKPTWKFVIINVFDKIKLFEDNIVFSNKETFLIELSKEASMNMDKTSQFNKIIWDLVITAKSLKWSTDEETIKNTYKYVTDHLEYSLDSSDNSIHSWLLSYVNWVGVCDWYSRLFLYLLSINWVKNISAEEWYILPEISDIWHSWIKIWDKYYDPTYDDPTWATTDVTTFKYYWIPEDIMYVDRFNLNKTSETDIRKSGDSKLLSDYYTRINMVYSKYKVSDYQIVWSYGMLTKLSSQLWINISELNIGALENWLKKVPLINGKIDFSSIWAWQIFFSPIVSDNLLKTIIPLTWREWTFFLITWTDSNWDKMEFLWIK